MSDPKPTYEIRTQYPMDPVTRQWIPTKWEPQGEICSRHDEIEQEPEPEAETIEDQIVWREDLMRELNLSLEDIEPWIRQRKVLRNCKNGTKLVYPCETRMYKLLTRLSREIAELREAANRD